MPDEIQVGDIMWFDLDNPKNNDLDQEYREEQPFVVIKPLYPTMSHTVRRMDGRPFNYGEGMHWSFYFYRFRKDIFLSAAKKACEHG